MKRVILKENNHKDLKTVSDFKGQRVSSTNEQSGPFNTCANVFIRKKKRKQMFAR